jgi:hypothetical protein
VRDFSQRVLDNARTLGLDALIVVGGDGTQKIGLELQRRGLPVVGVPKTIDNDLSATEVTFGLDTALHTATEAIDKIHTTAESHHRIMLVEVMGRDVGWIALESGLAGSTHVVLIPEIPFTIEHICEFVRQREQQGKRFTIIVVAEGVKLPPELAEKREQERRLSPRAHISDGCDCRCHRAHEQTRDSRHGAGTHPARWFAFALRPHPQHAFWGGGGGVDRHGRFREDGVPAWRASGGGGPRRGRRGHEVRRSQGRAGADRPRHWDMLRKLGISSALLY